jgi:hypothetical protein
MKKIIRSLRVAKLSPFDFKSCVSFKSCLPHLRANILSFTITVGPDEKRFCVPSLIRNVVGDSLFFLKPINEINITVFSF